MAVFLGANTILFYYILYINSVYGLVAYIIAHVKRFNEDGKECVDEQPGRAAVLLAEVIIFWVTFFLMSFPMLILKFMKKENIEKAYQGP